MNRKHKTLKWGIALVSSMLTLNLSAQSSLIDYQSDKVDLGMGVEQSQMLTTASVEVVSGDELQKTAAISLKEALYGKLLGLTVLRPGGTVSDYSSGAVFNIRGQQTTTENGVLVLVDGIERSIEYLTVDEVESVTVLKGCCRCGSFRLSGSERCYLGEDQAWCGGTSDFCILRS